MTQKLNAIYYFTLQYSVYNILLYFACIHSHLKYGIICWGSSKCANKLLMLRKRAIRNMVGARKLDSCRPLFKSLNILTLVSIYILECDIFVKKNIQTFLKNKDNHSYLARNNNCLDTMNNRTFYKKLKLQYGRFLKSCFERSVVA